MWLVIGATGQVGSALMAPLCEHDAVFLSRDEVDLSNPLEVKNTLSAFTLPTVVINAAAYTAVDKAEEEPDTAQAVNADSVGVIADYCASRNIPLIHYSTDYVYDGSGDQPRDETAATAPLNIYGKSKLGGEDAIRASGCDYLIFRTSWVYDADGKNFVNSMLRLGALREELNIVEDQIGAPSYAPHLAAATIACADKAMQMDIFPSGVYHMCNAGETSWRGFAEEIFATARAQGAVLKINEVAGIPTSAYPTPAVRPLNSRLNCDKLRETFDVSLPSWQDGVRACMEIKNERDEWAA